MPTAFVTGASRGIGKAIAVHLARAGYDIAITARTVQDGEGREHSSTLARSDTTPLPGSLTSTSKLVEEAGVRCLVVQADLTDRASMIAAADRVLQEWGRVDVLVNNGRYIGPGHMDRFEDTPLELLDRHIEANAMAPLALSQGIHPGHGGAGFGHHREHHLWGRLPRPPGRRRGRGVGPGLRVQQGSHAPYCRHLEPRAGRARASGPTTSSPGSLPRSAWPRTWAASDSILRQEHRLMSWRPW